MSSKNLPSINYLHQAESVRGCGCASRRARLPCKDRSYHPGRTFSQPDLHQGPHHDPHHVSEKPRPSYVNMDTITILDNIHRINAPDGCPGSTTGSAERGEI